MNTWDYPAGADTPDAPWNECDEDEERRRPLTKAEIREIRRVEREDERGCGGDD